MNYHHLIADLKFLLKNSKYIISTLAFIGVGEVFIYYSAFEINIAGFVSLSDFLLLAIDDYLLRIVIYIIIAFLTSAFIPTKALENAGKERITTYSMTFLNRQKKNIPWYLAITVNLLVYSFGKKHHPHEYFGVQTATICLFISFFILKDELIVTNKIFFFRRRSCFS